MNPFQYTCTPEADGSLTGTPARVAGIDGDHLILEFNEGSRLSVAEDDVMDLSD